MYRSLRQRSVLIFLIGTLCIALLTILFVVLDTSASEPNNNIVMGNAGRTSDQIPLFIKTINSTLSPSTLHISKSPEAIALFVPQCKYIESGPLHYVDDRGYVCIDSTFNATSSCCLENSSWSSSYSCDSTCDASNFCCSEYHYCVSCCLHPRRSSDIERALTNKVGYLKTYTQVVTALDLCEKICLTSSRSAPRFNKYSSAFHHCFSLV